MSHPNLIKCFCVPADPQSCIYRHGDVRAFGVDEDGKTISSHYCSNENFARMDIVHSVHQSKYAERYPGGYHTQWVKEPPPNWDGNPSHKPEITIAFSNDESPPKP